MNPSFKHQNKANILWKMRGSNSKKLQIPNTVEMAVSSSKMRQIAMKSTFKKNTEKQKQFQTPQKDLWTIRAAGISLHTDEQLLHLFFPFYPFNMKRSTWDDVTIFVSDVDQHRSARPMLCQGVWRRDCCNPPADAQLLPTRKHHGELMGIHQFHGVLTMTSYSH